jgi:pimeloyl-ACP methyl ester carboxylesterase
VIVGEQDLLTPPWICREVADRIPGAQFEIIKGDGSSHVGPAAASGGSAAVLATGHGPLFVTAGCNNASREPLAAKPLAASHKPQAC